MNFNRVTLQHNNEFIIIIFCYLMVSVIIMLYPTSASRVIVLLKTPSKYREFVLFVRTTVKISGISCHAGTAYASINDLTEYL